MVGRRLRVEVSDGGGPARLRRRIGAVRSAGGRGLELVRALASRWGVRESSAGRTIWFEVDLEAKTARSRTVSSSATTVTASGPSRTSTAVKWWRTWAATRSGASAARPSTR